MVTVVPRTWVAGTPRGYGNHKVASEWLNEMAAALATYRGAGEEHDRQNTRYEVTLEFRIHPESRKYWGTNKPHGTDLDNLVKQIIDALSETWSQNLPGGLGILAWDRAVYRIVATKELVSSDDETGVWITVDTI